MDDIVNACKLEEHLTNQKKKLCAQFDMKDVRKIHHFLGLKVVQNSESGVNWIGQPAYTEKVLIRYGMEDAKSVATPIDASTKLVCAVADDEMFDLVIYQSAVGSLL